MYKIETCFIYLNMIYLEESKIDMSIYHFISFITGFIVTILIGIFFIFMLLNFDICFTKNSYHLLKVYVVVVCCTEALLKDKLSNPQKMIENCSNLTERWLMTNFE